MTMLALTKDKDGMSGITNLPADELLYFQCNYGKTNLIDVYTTRGIFYTMGTLKYLMDSLNASGYRFSKGDRSASINLDKVVRVSDFFKTAYFDDGNKGCMLTNRGYHTLIDELQQANALYKNI